MFKDQNWAENCKKIAENLKKLNPMGLVGLTLSNSTQEYDWFNNSSTLHQAIKNAALDIVLEYWEGRPGLLGKLSLIVGMSTRAKPRVALQTPSLFIKYVIKWWSSFFLV